MIVFFFSGIEKAECSPLLIDKLKELLLNKYVTITVKGINGNVNLVTVEKLCENGSLNVADKLVMEGLVKSCSAENLRTEHQGKYSHLIASNDLICRTVCMWDAQVTFPSKNLRQFHTSPVILGKQCPCVFCSFTCFVFCRQWR